MSRVIKILILASLGLYLLGCATIITGGKAKVKITSVPSGAEVYYLNKKIGETPLEYAFTPGVENGKYFRLEKSGYFYTRLSLPTTVTAWFWANFLFPPGFLVDYFTGAYKGAKVKKYHIRSNKLNK